MKEVEDKSLLHTDKECSDMVKKYLKKNKPSVKFKDEKKPEFVSSESCLGRSIIW